MDRETGAQYESETALLDLITAITLRYVFKKERHFDNATGVEDSMKYARCKELVQIAFLDKGYPSIIGHFCYLGLDVSCDFDDYGYPGSKNIHGVALLRKFSIK